MDSIYLAVAGIALFVMGIVGFTAVALFFAGALIRYEVAPRVRPLLVKVANGGRNWVTPPERPRPALVPARSSAPRR